MIYNWIILAMSTSVMLICSPEECRLTLELVIIDKIGICQNAQSAVIIHASTSAHWTPKCLQANTLQVFVQVAANQMSQPLHYDVNKWKRFLRYWPFVWESTGYQWVSINAGFDVSVDVSLINGWTNSGVSSDLGRSLWRDCDYNIIYHTFESQTKSDSPKD